MSKAKAKSKKRNPQDATRRNVQAANKRLAAIELEITELWRICHESACRILKLERRRQ